MHQLSGTIAGISLGALLLGGCYTTDLDPGLGSVFACTQVEANCPSGLSCVNGVCESSEGVPRVLVTNPEDEQRFVTATPDIPIGPPPDPLTIEIRIQGELDLVEFDPDQAHVFGEGHVVVTVDGAQQAIIDTGSIDNPTAVTIDIDNQAGPHRITAQAVRNDGVPYDNPESTGTRLIWIESEAVEGLRPFVAIKSPWPGTTFPLDDAEITVELTTLNFEMIPPDQGSIEGKGHAHIYYDKAFPDCLGDMDCDADYIAVVGAPPSSTFQLPDSGARSVDLAAVLREVGHDQYRFPYACDPMIDLEVCKPIFDTVTLERADQ